MTIALSNDRTAASGTPADQAVLAASFTLVICTLDRLALLKQAVSTALEQIAAFRHGRLLVVDNGSTDGSTDYVRELAALHPCMSVLTEARLGVYYARAAAIKAATGDFIVFLDDDVLPDPEWLMKLLSPLVHEPKIGVSCGIARPLWITPRPDWLPDRFLDEFSLMAPAGRRQYCHFPSFPPAMSLALRRHACLELFCHPRRAELALGRRSTDDRQVILTGEDSDLCEIYVRNGFEVIVEDGPSVAHAIHPTRLTPDWFLRKFNAEGRSRLAMCRLLGLPVIGRYSWKLLASLPILAVTLPVTPLLRRHHGLLLRAYWQKSTGAWSELLWGRRVAPLPFRLSDVS